jgi:hypothetical protein
MFESLGNKKNHVEAIIVFVVCLGISIAAVPTFRDDPDKPVLLNVETKQLVHQQVLSETFLLAVFVSGVAGILWFARKSEVKPVVRLRNIIEVWANFPPYFQSKMKMPTVQDKNFSNVWDTPLDERHYLIRYPMYDEGVFRYLAVDMCEDWARYGTTPYRGHIDGNMGIERAKSLLLKKTAPYGKLYSQLEAIGISPEEARRKKAEAEIEKEKERRDLPIGGPQESG